MKAATVMPDAPDEKEEAEARAWKEDADADFKTREAVKERIRRDDGKNTDEEKRGIKLALQMEEKVLAGTRFSSKQTKIGIFTKQSTLAAKKAMHMNVSNETTKTLISKKVKTKYSQLDPPRSSTARTTSCTDASNAFFERLPSTSLPSS